MQSFGRVQASFNVIGGQRKLLRKALDRLSRSRHGTTMRDRSRGKPRLQALFNACWSSEPGPSRPWRVRQPQLATRSAEDCSSDVGDGSILSRHERGGATLPAERHPKHIHSRRPLTVLRTWPCERALSFFELMGAGSIVLALKVFDFEMQTIHHLR